MDLGKFVVPPDFGVGQPSPTISNPIRNVAPVLVTPTSMQNEQVERVSHEASPLVFFDEGCSDIHGQVSKGANFESQLRDIDKELSKFDTPSTP